MALGSTPSQGGSGMGFGGTQGSIASRALPRLPCSRGTGWQPRGARVGWGCSEGAGEPRELRAGLRFGAVLQLPATCLSENNPFCHLRPSVLSHRHPKSCLGTSLLLLGGFSKPGVTGSRELGAEWLELLAGFCPRRCRHGAWAAAAVRWDLVVPQASPCCVPGGTFVFQSWFLEVWRAGGSACPHQLPALDSLPTGQGKRVRDGEGEKDNSEVHQDKAEGRNGQVEHQGKRLSSVFIPYKYSDGLLLP